ncbi:hypothetical protein FSP39_006697 [Pinctada imbricata]|uniref:Protein NATD1 n=1 Tax=Pinctada imbricata TaxID=66713 RepID=A0AA88XU06_PINIB|nr:hypothetical protein FSP39_006697 [Pinctada imbricata]
METRSMQRRKIAEKTLSQSTLFAGHDEKKKEFYVELPYAEGKTKAVPRAILQYEWIQDKYVDLYHTGVPEEFRGKGVAKILAEAALDHFVRDDVTMRLSCTYLQYHVEKYPIPRIMEKVDKTW